MKRWLLAVVLVALAGAACSPGTNALAPSRGRGSSHPPTATSPTAATSISPTVPASPTARRFESSIVMVRPGLVRYSWHSGCPVPIRDLRLLTLTYRGFDGVAHQGELIVHREVARDVAKVFRILFEEGFPIRRMELIDAYRADDDRSMAANNTSAFNCRAVTGGTSFSEHSFGWAIDINPLLNPYVASDRVVLPPAGARYADRSLDEPGMIHAGDLVVRAFASIDWTWGGSWSGVKDYQHFSATGR